MKKFLILLLVSVSAFSADFEVLPVSADTVFNYFFTIYAVWAVIIAGFVAALSLFRL